MSRALATAISVVAFLLAACVSAPTRAPQVVSPATAAALDAANAAFSAAWAIGDGAALAGAYTPDAVLHPPAGGVLTTPAEVRDLLAPAPTQRRVGHRLEPTLRQRLSGGEVLEMGRWHSARANDAGEALWLSGCYTVIWREDEGRWRMRYDAWTAPNDNVWACRPR